VSPFLVGIFFHELSDLPIALSPGRWEMDLRAAMFLVLGVAISAAIAARWISTRMSGWAVFTVIAAFGILAASGVRFLLLELLDARALVPRALGSALYHGILSTAMFHAASRLRPRPEALRAST
jgi:hypothetical protein